MVEKCKIRKWTWMTLAIFCMWGGYIEIAAADIGGEASIAGVLERLAELLTGKIAKAIGTLAVICCGYFAYLGHLTIRAAFNVAMAIGIIFGSTEIAKMLMGG